MVWVGVLGRKSFRNLLYSLNKTHTHLCLDYTGFTLRLLPRNADLYILTPFLVRMA